VRFPPNSGDPVDVGYSDFIKEDNIAGTRFGKELRDAIEYFDSVKPFWEGIVTIADYKDTASTRDWFYATSAGMLNDREGHVDIIHQMPEGQETCHSVCSSQNHPNWQYWLGRQSEQAVSKARRCWKTKN
jgi:hypothetical protein